jgi:glycine/D-amino acid oxidase-like deaminating enzyme
MKNVETVIIGQGLAGTAVAWSLINRGRDFYLIDDGNPQSSSQIAAGLVTPVTGQRHVESWNWQTAYPIANRFYQDCELVTKSHFWKAEPAIRFFTSQDERDRFEDRYRSEATYHHTSFGSIGTNATLSEEIDPLGWSREIDSSFGGFIMSEAARLLTTHFLKASRDHFESMGRLCVTTIAPSTDVVLSDEAMVIEPANVRCKNLVFCEGHTALQNPWFSPIELVPAQGDILTVRIPGLKLDRVLHAGFWIAPVQLESVNDESLFHIGSTYRWSPLNGVPNEESRTILVDRLRSLIRLPFEVVDHRAAIRPAGFDHKPLMGNHRSHAGLWILNGLGAKGVLLSPWCAQMLVDSMLFQQPIPSELAWNRKRKGNG